MRIRIAHVRDAFQQPRRAQHPSLPFRVRGGIAQVHSFVRPEHRQPSSRQCGTQRRLVRGHVPVIPRVPSRRTPVSTSSSNILENGTP
ncbi:MAG: hypothetical protein HC933_21510 [Pleurocapsa sp. SU_196_0]|nr:hypothetical protein [Pleurocapsa sp. SU_196_0]